MNLRRFKNPVSAATMLIIAAVLITNFFVSQNYKDKSKVLLCDIVGYYNYLPSFFIRHDVALQENVCPLVPNAPNEKGQRVPKMTVGLAYLYSPFFFAANAYVNIAGIECDEYDLPYSFALFFSSLFFSILGFVFLRKLLLMFFPDISVSLTMISVAFATNIYYYIIDFGPLSHAYSFCLFSIFIYFSIKWYEAQSYKNTIILGLTGGLIFLIRPVNGLIILFFLFYNITDKQSFSSRILILLKNYRKILLMVIIAFVLWLPQLAFWKYVSGQWLYYTYSEEGFFWFKPMTFYGLFCYRNGWLVYTPIMTFSIIGMFFLRKELKRFALPVISYFLIIIYVVFCWWCWWYNGFGNRAMIESYALLSIPMTAFYSYILKRKIVFKILLCLILSFFIFLNFFQISQFRRNLIDWEGMTKEAYWSVFLNNQYPSNLYTDLIKKPDYKKAVKGNE
jgi:hypothetical protein